MEAGVAIATPACMCMANIYIYMCVLFIILVIIGTAVDVLLWFINDIFPNLFLSETESMTATDSKFCEVY